MPSSSTSSSSTDWLRATPNSQVPPYQLRALVLEYLCHSCYSKTAECFARDSAVQHLNADGDEVSLDRAELPGHTASELSEELLLQIQHRKRTRQLLLGGKVEEAMDMLNEHFPSVLASSKAGDPALEYTPPILTRTEYTPPASVDPAYLSLNLRILSFIEACRTSPLSYPPRSSSRNEHTSSEVIDLDDTTPRAETTRFESPEPNIKGLEEKVELLSKLRKLRALADALPNAHDKDLFIKELNNVGGLLAYRIPEASSISRYLSQERREAVADQIDHAILNAAGFPPISSLELLVRYITTLRTLAEEHRQEAPERHPTGPQKDEQTIFSFNLSRFTNSIS